MKILHCSDLHLDAKMETGLTPARARERRAELLMTFSRLVETAEEEGAGAILLAGDLFDTTRAGEHTRRYVGEAVAAHPALRFLAVTGNHDGDLAPLFPGDCPPDNWVCFPAEGWGSVELDGRVSVSGTSDPSRPGAWEDLPVPPPDRFHIVLLHGQVVRTGEGGGENIPLRRLAGRGIDYLALGHEHSAHIEPLDRRGLWAYCGCPEGRGFDECGDKGCLLLDTEAPEGERVRFIPLARRTLHLVPVAIDGALTHTEVEGAMLSALADIPEEDMVKVVLTGEVSPDLCFDGVHLRRLLEERFYFARFKDETRLRLCPEDYAGDISLKGEFIRTVMASRLSAEDKQRTILCGLRALRGEEVEA